MHRNSAVLNTGLGGCLVLLGLAVATMLPRLCAGGEPLEVAAPPEVSAAEYQRLTDLEQQAAAARKSLQEATGKLIALVEDTKVTEAYRHRAVVALGQLGTCGSLEYLVEHIDLRLSPGGFSSEDPTIVIPCYHALLFLPQPGDNHFAHWNAAQAVLRAVAKPRTEHELFLYAELLHYKLGVPSTDRVHIYGKASGALAFVEVELVNISEKPPSPESPEARAARAVWVKNLTALKRHLEEITRQE
jgi:hypothetical protein